VFQTEADLFTLLTGDLPARVEAHFAGGRPERTMIPLTLLDNLSIINEEGK
jgi:hypothetical protein